MNVRPATPNVRRRDLISRRTRIAFREHLVGWVLREIDDLFEGEGLLPGQSHATVSGQRRSRVEEYYAAVDWTSFQDVNRVLRAYEEILRHIPDDAPERRNLVDLLERDGYSVREGRIQPRGPAAQLQELKDQLPTLASSDVDTLVDRLRRAVDTDPALAVGTAKELIEAVCRSILVDRGVDARGATKVPSLIKQTCKELRLVPDAIPDSAKGAEVIRRLLSNLTAVATGLAELRNLYGSGHGRGPGGGGLEPRHAHLAVGAAATLVTFLVQTHHKRRGQEAAPR